MAARMTEVSGMNIRLILFSFVIFAFTSAGTAGEKLSVKVSPTVAFAPANLTVRAIVESDPGNHAVEISAESPDFYRSSELGLEGENAPRTTTFEFRGLPTGTYEVRAMLLGASGEQRAIARQRVDVISSPREK
jgi:hypothetical protein